MQRMLPNMALRRLRGRFVENTVSKCSVLNKSSTSTQSPPQSSQCHVQQHPQHPHPQISHSLLMLPKINILNLNCTNIQPSLLNAMFGSILEMFSLNIYCVFSESEYPSHLNDVIFGSNSILSFNNFLIHSTFKCFLI